MPDCTHGDLSFLAWCRLSWRGRSRHDAKIKDVSTGRTYDYRGKDGVSQTEITLQKGAPDGAKQRYQTFAGDRPEALAEAAKASLSLWESLILYEVQGTHPRRDMARLAREKGRTA